MASNHKTESGHRNGGGVFLSSSDLFFEGIDLTTESLGNGVHRIMAGRRPGGKLPGRYAVRVGGGWQVFLTKTAAAQFTQE